MSNEPYTLLDAIREEIDTLKELEAVFRKQEKRLAEADVDFQRRSLTRILNRFEKGYEYYMGVHKGEPQLQYRQGTRHLEREYPAVAEAKAHLDTVTGLVKGD